MSAQPKYPDKAREHMTMRIPVNLKRELQKRAEADRRSFSNLVQMILADWVEAQK